MQHGFRSARIGSRRSESVSACRISSAIAASGSAALQPRLIASAASARSENIPSVRSSSPSSRMHSSAHACLHQHNHSPQQLNSQVQQKQLDAHGAWDQIWSEEVPALVMDRPIAANPDPWYWRLQQHGFVAGNMMTHSTGRPMLCMQLHVTVAIASNGVHKILQYVYNLAALSYHPS